MSNACVELKAKVWSPGNKVVEGAPLVVEESISFLGDVDPERGVIRSIGAELRGRILVARGFRGSTVGSYILYAMSKRGVAPKAIVFRELDPVVVAGCVASSIPMAWCPSLDLSLAKNATLAAVDPRNSVVRLCS